MRPFTIANLRTMRGREGLAFSCELHYQGKLAALVVETGDGGDLHWSWSDTEARTAYEAWVKSLPPVTWSGDISVKRDESVVLTELVDELELNERLRAAARKKTLVRRPSTPSGSWMEFAAPDSPDLRKEILATFPDAMFLNDKISSGERVALGCPDALP